MKRLACLVLCLASCLSAQSALASRPQAADSLDQIEWGRVAEYRLAPGDLLKFNFGPAPSISGTYVDLIREATVRPDGRVTVFPVGDVVAAGRTPSELQAVLVELLASELKQPRVTVEVEKPASSMVYVLGRVKKPGSQPVSFYSTLLQAISDAGGFEDDAARNSVVILHRVGLREVSASRVRADRLLKGAGDVPLSRFDIVYVPRSTIGNLDVFVEQFFSHGQTALATTFVGWELFNLDRIFITTPSH